MIQKNSLVLYKKQPGIVNSVDGDKFLIKFLVISSTLPGKKRVFGEQKVREKDIVLLHEKTVSSLEDAIDFSDEKILEQINEAYLLLESDDTTKNSDIPFGELCEYIRNSFLPNESYFIFKTLSDSLEFALDEEKFKNGEIFFIPRSQEEISQIKQKIYEKEHEEEIRKEFIKRLKDRKLLPEDAKFMGEVEAVAFGKIENSRTLKEAGIVSTPENAHKLLIETGIWDITKNPYPARYSLTTVSAHEGLMPPPEEERLEVPGISYAIDSPWSDDPDDAISFDGEYLWVHIADPASSVLPSSSIDKNARSRGTTLYIPEGAVRMLCETCLEDYALGLKEKCNALSFKIKLSEENTIEKCEIYKTSVHVKRLTYQQADELKDTPELKPLFEIARKNILRRNKSGSVQIQLPELHINVDKETKKVSISELKRYESDSVVCEAMLLAGEGAAYFAMNNRIPFPYISQEAPEIPKNIRDGISGQFQLLKCMRKRSVGVTPGMHSGLGLALYSQVTSPLRRYSDLIAHQQLRAFLDKRPLIDKDEMLMRISEGDASSVAARKVSRLSETHWKLIYLLQNPEWTGTEVNIEKKDGENTFFIRELAMQTVIKGLVDIDFNEELKVRACNINIPFQTVDFVPL